MKVAADLRLDTPVSHSASGQTREAQSRVFRLVEQFARYGISRIRSFAMLEAAEADARRMLETRKVDVGVRGFVIEGKHISAHELERYASTEPGVIRAYAAFRELRWRFEAECDAYQCSCHPGNPLRPIAIARTEQPERDVSASRRESRVEVSVGR